MAFLALADAVTKAIPHWQQRSAWRLDLLPYKREDKQIAGVD
jgi:hypothetical protein